MKSLKVATGANPIESKAIAARLKRLGVEVSEDGRVSEASLENSSVKGGFDALAEAARLQGGGDVLDLSALDKISVDHSTILARLKRSADLAKETKAMGQLKSASMALEGAARGLRNVGERKTGSAEELARISRSIANGLKQTKAALDDETLGYAKSSNVQRLASAYLDVLTAYVIYGKDFEQVANEQVFPKLNEPIEMHNNAWIPFRLLTGFAAFEAAAVGNDIVAINDNILALVDFAKEVVNPKPAAKDAQAARAPEPTFARTLRADIGKEEARRLELAHTVSEILHASADPDSVLKIGAGDTPKSQYRSLANVFHPDKNATLNLTDSERSALEEAFKTVNLAWSASSANPQSKPKDRDSYQRHRASAIQSEPAKVEPEQEPLWRTKLRTGNAALDKAVLAIYDWSEECYEVGAFSLDGAQYHLAVLGAGSVLFKDGKPADVFSNWDREERGLFPREGSTGAFEKLPSSKQAELKAVLVHTLKTERFM